MRLLVTRPWQDAQILRPKLDRWVEERRLVQKLRDTDDSTRLGA